MIDIMAHAVFLVEHRKSGKMEFELRFTNMTCAYFFLWEDIILT